MHIPPGPYRVHYDAGEDEDYGWSIITRGTTIVEGIYGEGLANLIALAPRMAAALRAASSNEHANLDDMIYHVRENEGLGWDGPSVVKWGDAVGEINAILAELDGTA